MKYFKRKICIWRALSGCCHRIDFLGYRRYEALAKHVKPFLKKNVKVKLCVIVVSRTSIRVKPHSIVCLNVKELLARSRYHIWSLSDSNVIRIQNYLVRKRTLKPFSQTSQMIELCCEYLSVSCIWLFAIIMSRTIIRVNPHSIVYLNVKEILARSRKSLLRIVFRIYKLKDLNFDVLPEDFARKLEEIRLIPVGRNRENYVFRHTKY